MRNVVGIVIAIAACGGSDPALDPVKNPLGAGRHLCRTRRRSTRPPTRPRRPATTSTVPLGAFPTATRITCRDRSIRPGSRRATAGRRSRRSCGRRQAGVDPTTLDRAGRHRDEHHARELDGDPRHHGEPVRRALRRGRRQRAGSPRSPGGVPAPGAAPDRRPSLRGRDHEGGQARTAARTSRAPPAFQAVLDDRDFGHARLDRDRPRLREAIAALEARACRATTCSSRGTSRSTTTPATIDGSARRPRCRARRDGLGAARTSRTRSRRIPAPSTAIRGSRGGSSSTSQCPP